MQHCVVHLLCGVVHFMCCIVFRRVVLCCAVLCICCSVFTQWPVLLEHAKSRLLSSSGSRLIEVDFVFSFAVL